MRDLIRPLLVVAACLVLLPLIAFSQASYTSGNGSAHYAQLATTIDLADSPTAGVALPDDARYAFVQAEGGDVRITTDGRDPSAAGVGLILADGDARWLSSRSQLVGFRAYELDAASELQVEYMKY